MLGTSMAKLAMAKLTLAILTMVTRTGGGHPLEERRALGDVHDEGRVGVARLEW